MKRNELWYSLEGGCRGHAKNLCLS